MSGVGELVVDGHPRAGNEPEFGMRDDDGTPTFTCRPGSPMARAARSRRGALITVRSGLGPPSTPARRHTLTVTGRLATGGLQHCACCGEVRVDAVLELDFVVLARAGVHHGPGGRAQVRVPVLEFGSPGLRLNPGYLQRAVEHANDCHRDELRHLVATTTGTRVEDLLGVLLTDLTRRGVELSWVDADGAHRTGLAFSRPARTVEELAVLLRYELHAASAESRRPPPGGAPARRRAPFRAENRRWARAERNAPARAVLAGAAVRLGAAAATL